MLRHDVNDAYVDAAHRINVDATSRINVNATLYKRDVPAWVWKGILIMIFCLESCPERKRIPKSEHLHDLHRECLSLHTRSRYKDYTEDFVLYLPAKIYLMCSLEFCALFAMRYVLVKP